MLLLLLSCAGRYTAEYANPYLDIGMPCLGNYSGPLILGAKDRLLPLTTHHSPLSTTFHHLSNDHHHISKLFCSFLSRGCFQPFCLLSLRFPGRLPQKFVRQRGPHVQSFLLGIQSHVGASNGFGGTSWKHIKAPEGIANEQLQCCAHSFSEYLPRPRDFGLMEHREK